MESKEANIAILIVAFVFVGLNYFVELNPLSNDSTPLSESMPMIANSIWRFFVDFLPKQFGTWAAVGFGLVALLIVVFSAYPIASFAAANLAIRIFMIEHYPITWPVVVFGLIGWGIVIAFFTSSTRPFAGARGAVLFLRR